MKYLSLLEKLINKIDDESNVLDLSAEYGVKISLKDRNTFKLDNFIELKNFTIANSDNLSSILWSENLAPKAFHELNSIIYNKNENSGQMSKNKNNNNFCNNKSEIKIIADFLIPDALTSILILIILDEINLNVLFLDNLAQGCVVSAPEDKHQQNKLFKGKSLFYFKL